ERAGREVLEPRRRRGQSQQRLGLHEHEGTTRSTRRLAPQHVEVLRRRRRIRDYEVALGDELEKALEARAGVLGPLALVAVRQEQHESGVLTPFGAVGEEELA